MPFACRPLNDPATLIDTGSGDDNYIVSRPFSCLEMLAGGKVPASGCRPRPNDLVQIKAQHQQTANHLLFLLTFTAQLVNKSYNFFQARLAELAEGPRVRLAAPPKLVSILRLCWPRASSVHILVFGWPF
jgi:hypothetical protein